MQAAEGEADEDDGLSMSKTVWRLAAAAFVCALFAMLSAAHAEQEASGDLAKAVAPTAADTAQILRDLAFGRLDDAKRPDLDLTGNGMIDKTDVRAMLLYASGGITDPDAFRKRVSGGLCGESLFERFSYTGVIDDGPGNYRSDRVSVAVSHGRANASDYHLADIYVQDISCITTAFGGGRYRGEPDTVKNMFGELDNGVVAINGDYYTQHYYGPIVRNGETYLERVNRSWDIALLLKSGEFVTYDRRALTGETLAALDVYQSWVFGPALLDEDGHAKTRFHSAVQPENPRSVIGYYEPGHYAFLAVDGRSKSSDGMTMQQLSQLCEDLGFARAYNLDGGQSSVLLSRNGPINSPFRNGRPISDIIAICNPQAAETSTTTE